MGVSVKLNDVSTRFNESRISKMISSQSREEALYMGAWDSFKDLFKNDVKRKSIEHLYSLLTEKNSTSELNPNLSKFLNFIKIRDLAKEENKSKFNVIINQGHNYFENSHVLFTINKKIIYKSLINRFEENFICNFIDTNNVIKLETNENYVREKLIEASAASKIQRVFCNHVEKRLIMASEGVKGLCASIGEKITSCSQIAVGDVLITSFAEPFEEAYGWSRHGAIHLITHFVEKQDTSGKIVRKIFSKRLELNSNDKPNEVIFGKVGDFKFRETDTEEKRIQYYLNFDAIYRLRSLSYDELKESFIHTAKKAEQTRSYSRQYNCNHVVFETLKHALLKKKKLTLTRKSI